MKRILTAIATVLTTLIFMGSSAAAQGQYASGSVGTDVSWPNCSSKIASSSFGIVGVTGGKGFTQNSCLKAESSHFSNLSLYVNTGYPGAAAAQAYQNTPKTCLASDLNCLAYNYGYNAGLYALNYAHSQGVSSSSWWLDAETMNTWSQDTNQNQNSLSGEIAALRDGGVGTVGVYSTTAQWKTITNGWQNLLPSWGATTWTTAKQAATYCHGHEFTGGPSYLMQYTPKRGLDQDYAC